MATTTQSFEVSRRVPAPQTLPIVGSKLALLNFVNHPIAFLTQRHQRYGHLSAVSAFKPGTDGMLLAFAPQYNQQVLNDPARFYSLDLNELGRSALTRLTSGLVNMNGERHKQHRRLIMPAFHRQAVAGYRDDMVALTDTMLNQWQAGASIDVYAEMRQLVLTIVSRSLFGFERDEENVRMGGLVSQWLRLANSPSAYYLPQRKRQLTQLSEQVETDFRALIERKRRAGASGNDVLSMLIQAHDEDGVRLNDDELIGHTAILFIAGHETTVLALTWTLFLLTQYPAVYADVVDELDGTLRGAAPTVEQTGQLPLLDRIIKESMRVLPPILYTMRLAQEPFEMGGYPVGKGGGVILSHYITHRLPELYPQPDQFMPERWLTIDPSPYEYLPFSAGPRMCIGATFASLEIRIVLAMLLQRFRLGLVPGATVDYQEVANGLLPKGGLTMNVHAPDRQYSKSPVRGTIRQLVKLGS